MGLLFFGRSKTEGEKAPSPPFTLRESVQVEYQGKCYPGQVKSCKADGLWVEWTTNNGAAPHPGRAEPVTLFSSERSEGEGFRALVVEDAGSGSSRLKIVSRVALGVVHRRKDVRVPYQFPVRFRPADDSPSPARWVDTHTHDLSGGGVRAYVRGMDLPSPGDRLELELELPRCAPIRATAEVAWTGPAGTSATLFEMGLRFVEMSEPDWERVFRRVFERQVELHRSGLI
jgi:hypothetical protein